MDQDRVYPIYPRLSRLEQSILRAKRSPGFCPVCGRLTVFSGWTENFRDGGICWFCRSKNRQRQVAYVLCRRGNLGTGRFFYSIKNLQKQADAAIYNAEASGALHTSLSRFRGYISSEYLSAEFSPGQIVNGTRHEDLGHLSFPDEIFDMVITSDVLEHIPLPYQAHREIFRVLKRGGKHVFTVPFHQTRYFDEILAQPGNNDEPILLKQPVYHHDPIRPDGILVYTIFSLEMLLRLREIGFQTSMYRLYHPLLGILGANGLVFEAIKEQ